MGLRRLPTLANHCAQRASFALLQGKWIEFRELTYKCICGWRLLQVLQKRENTAKSRRPVSL
eukprot:COSAG02_NODE_3374_length_6847_cov_15.475697_6_plen_62_part_00